MQLIMIQTNYAVQYETCLQMENIGKFLDYCYKLGCKKEDLFQTADLYDCINIPQVRTYVQKHSDSIIKFNAHSTATGFKWLIRTRKKGQIRCNIATSILLGWKDVSIRKHRELFKCAINHMHAVQS